MTNANENNSRLSQTPFQSTSRNGFEPYWVGSVGQPYFTGTNTHLVREVASRVIYELQDLDEKLMFDKWVIESIKRISSQDRTVGFPVQLVAVREIITDVFPANEEHNYLPEFEAGFPEL